MEMNTNAFTKYIQIQYVVDGAVKGVVTRLDFVRNLIKVRVYICSIFVLLSSSLHVHDKT